MPPGLFRDDPAHAGRTGEIDPPHRRMRDQRLDDLAGILGRVGDRVERPFGQPRLKERFNDQPMGARAKL